MSLNVGGVGLAVPPALTIYGSCSVLVTVTASSTKPTIWSDNAGTVITDPFTAASNGYFEFYPAGGRYDVTVSGGTPAPGISPPATYADIEPCDSFGPNADACGGSGSLGNVNWDKNGSAVGTEPGADFIEGTNITITATNDSGASTVHYTINSSAGGTTGPGAQDEVGYYNGAGTTSAIIGSPILSANPATGVTVAPPTGTGVGLKVNCDAHSSDCQDWLITGGGKAAWVDNLGGGHFTSLDTGPSGTVGCFQFFDLTTNFVNLCGANAITTYTATLPAAQGTGNLTNDGAGNLYWSTTGKVDSTALAADVGTTTLFAVPASGAGLYRITVYAIVTTVASTGAATSTMPSVVIAWTDADNVTAQTLTLTPPNSGNLLTTYTQGIMVLNARQSTNIQYSTSGYASNTAAQMRFSLHIRAEQM